MIERIKLIVIIMTPAYQDTVTIRRRLHLRGVHAAFRHARTLHQVSEWDTVANKKADRLFAVNASFL